MADYIWIVEVLFRSGETWQPTVFAGLTKKDAQIKAQSFKKRNCNTLKVRVVQYFK